MYNYAVNFFITFLRALSNSLTRRHKKIKPKICRRFTMATKKAENLNKGLLVEDVVAATGLTKKQAAAAVAAVLGSVQKTLKKGGKVAIVGFGTFGTSKRKARKGINPKTKEQIKIAAKTVVKFKASSALLGK